MYRLFPLIHRLVAHLRMIPTLLCMALPCLGGLPAQAQTGLTLPPFAPIITVTPAAADPGVARTLALSGTWPDSCVPGNPALSTSTVNGQDTVSIVLTIPQTLVACAQALTPYSAAVTHTPSKAGVQRIAVLLADGRFLGSGTLITQPAGQARSTQDFTGAWFDPATSGSGLALFHAFATSDVLAGAWYAFDNAGKPFWYLIQNGRWAPGGRYIGQLVESQAGAGPCSIALPACVKPQQGARIIATLSLQVLAQDRLRVTVTPAGEVTPAVILAEFEVSRLRF